MQVMEKYRLIYHNEIYADMLTVFKETGRQFYLL